ncbi:9426_t:CDS:2, partial [Dentiscutata erythropus]
AYFLALFKDKNEQAIHWPGKINYFLQHTMLLPANHTLCIVDWFNQSTILQKNYFLLLNELDLKDRLSLAKIWETKFQTRSYEKFFPVQKILCKFVRENCKLNNQSKYFYCAFVVFACNARFNWDEIIID